MQPLADDAALHLVAFAAGNGPSLMRKVIARVGGSIGWPRRSVRRPGSHNVSATVAVAHAGDERRCRRPRRIDRLALQPAKGSTLETRRSRRSSPVRDNALTVSFGLTRPERCGRSGYGRETDRLERRHQHAERAVFSRRRGRRDRAPCQNSDPCCRPGFRFRRHPALLGRTIEHREIELLLRWRRDARRGRKSRRALRRRARRLVDLVDDDDRLEAELSALASTNLVCGIGPSDASTSRSTPSTMCRMRSTSPPKSA